MESLKSRVTCSQCENLFKGDNSKLLPCLHTFCVDCLRKLPVTLKCTAVQLSPTQTQDVTPTETFLPRFRHVSSGSLTTPADTVSTKPPSDNKVSVPTRNRAKLKLPLTQAPRSRSHSDPGSPQLARFIKCPQCQRDFELPESGIEGFQTSLIVCELVSTFKSLENLGRESGPRCCHCIPSPLAVAYCEKCHYFICNGCDQMHKVWIEYQSHKVIPLESLQLEESEAPSKGVCVCVCVIWYKQGKVIVFSKNYLLYHLSVALGMTLYQKLLANNDTTGSKFPAFLTRPRSLHEIKCLKHSNETVKFFCFLCYDLLCHDCTILTHRDHPVVSITSELLSDHRSHMNSTLGTVSDLKQTLDVMASKTLTEREAFLKQLSEVEDSIKTAFQKLEEALVMRREKLMSELSELQKEPLKSFEDRESEIARIQEQVVHSKTYIEEDILHTGPTSMLSVQRTILENSNILSSEFEKIPVLKKPPRYKLIHSDHLLSSISCFGQVHVYPPSDDISVAPRFNNSQHSIILPGDVSLNVTGNQIPGFQTFSNPLFFGSSDSDPQNFSISSLPSKSDSSMVQSDSLNCLLPDLQYVNFFSIKCPRVAGDAIRVISGISRPSGIVSTNNLLVCEFGSDHRLSVFNHQGMFIDKYGTMGPKDGQLLYPQCVAVDNTGKMFITDSNYRVQVFDVHGQWLNSVGTKGKGELQFKDPVGIAIGKNCRVFVCERENSRIQVLNHDLTHHSFIGKKGKHSVEFNQPTDITIDHYGLLYVVDSWNHRIQVLTQEGVFVREIGSKGSRPGQLLSPSHICVDPDGFIYISELRNDRISMFTIKGDFVKSFGESGCGLGELSQPHGVTLDLNKVLYVSDYGNNRIHVFK